jgi:hypothetical protein
MGCGFEIWVMTQSVNQNNQTHRNHMLIIGLTGKKGCGKSTAAKSITPTQNFDVIVSESFARPLKAMVGSLLYEFEIDTISASDKDALLPDIGCNLRHLYQTLGTEWGRTFIDPDLWINSMVVRLRPFYSHTSALIVIDDVRFENEADYIRRKGGVIVHIERTGLISNDDHASENGITFQDGDIKLVNSNLDDFTYQFQCLVDNLAYINRPDFLGGNPGATNLGLSLQNPAHLDPIEGQSHAQ